MQQVRTSSRYGGIGGLLLGALVAFATPAAAQAPSPQAKTEMPKLDELLSGIVRVRTYINPDGRTVATLGERRTGSGVVIDDTGLVVTIGYLMVEAHSADLITQDNRTVKAEVLGYDHDTGFGLLKALSPLKVRPFSIGKSAELKEREPVLAASWGGIDGVAPALVGVKREFAGGWEYLINDAIFTTPPHNDWSGAALINKEGKLVGVGALIITDITGKGANAPGNMYVPIDLLTPVLADLMAGHGNYNDKPRPWIGMTTEEVRGKLFVARTAEGGPAEKAGLQKGDIIVGVGGEPASGLADFYRKIWKQGEAGVTVPLDILGEGGLKRVDIPSMNRNDYLRLRTTF